MIPPNLLARLAGAQPDVLNWARTDRVKYTAMGGVLLTTAGVAGTSAAFALNTAVGLPVWAAVITGALWAVVIFNLDRMLVVSMTRQSGWLRNLLSAIPRLALAVVIGAVISVPLVLRIFQPELDAELVRLHSDNAAANHQKLVTEFADIDTMQREVDEQQAIATGQKQPAVTENQDVKAAQARVDAAQTAYNDAARKAQCELDGSCGTGHRGDGTVYTQAKALADQAEQTLNDAKDALALATGKARTTIDGGTVSNKQAAQDRLNVLVPQLADRKAQQAARQAEGDATEAQNNGLLARLQALDRLSANNATMQSANFALFLLFLFLEVLPVMVKLLTMVGNSTLYDRLLVQAETKLQNRATQQDSVDEALDQHRVAEQIRQGKEATTLLVDKQAEIARKAIDTWGRIAADRSDQELGRWFAQHGGTGPAPTRGGPAPVSGPPTIAAPTVRSTAHPPAATVDPNPPTVPLPAVRGAQSYQQYKATVGTPAGNGSQPTGPIATGP